MIIYTGKDLARSFRDVRGNTITIAEDIPEERYTFQATPEVRSVARLLIHIALTPRFQLTTHTNRIVDLATINFGDVLARAAADEAQPRSKVEILELLRTEAPDRSDEWKPAAAKAERWLANQGKVIEVAELLTR